jgi:hypothetical protein
MASTLEAPYPDVSRSAVASVKNQPHAHEVIPHIDEFCEKYNIKKESIQNVTYLFVSI